MAAAPAWRLLQLLLVTSSHSDFQSYCSQCYLTLRPLPVAGAYADGGGASIAIIEAEAAATSSTTPLARSWRRKRRSSVQAEGSIPWVACNREALC